MNVFPLPGLAAWELALGSAPADRDDESPAELHPCLLQPGAKIVPTRQAYNVLSTT